jgi:membrane protein DedA with SNARE-associated domain
MFKGLIAWYLGALETGGYPLVALLMAIESSIAPLPSEFVIPPAAHLVYAKKCDMNMTGIIVAGAIGSWVGATAMYWASRIAGRPLVMRYGKYFFISPEKIAGAERWAARFGSMGIFISRFLPVVRHLIGIPAGIVRMNYTKFSIYTLLGSAIWCGVLCWIGVVAGQDEKLVAGNVHRLSQWIVGAAVVLGLMYYFLVHRFMKADSKNN